MSFCIILRKKVAYQKHVKGKEANFQEGDLVLVKVQAMPRGTTKKLAAHYKGPYKIISVDGPVVYLKPTQKHGRTEKQHMRNIKPYIHSPEGETEDSE